MPIKGIIFIFLIVAVVMLSFKDKVYTEINKIFKDKKDEEPKE